MHPLRCISKPKMVNSQCRKWNCIMSFKNNRNQMEYLLTKEKTSKTLEKRQAQSSRRVQSQKFIPPTHPAYVITHDFEAPHITHLQDECDKNYIAMGMQTSKKKLMKIPDMPSDRFFVIVDDSLGKPLLQGEFITMNCKIVHYPMANNLVQVIQAFKEQVGLGHFQTSEQYYQINDGAINEVNQNTLYLEKGKIEVQPSAAQQMEGESCSNKLAVGLNQIAQGSQLASNNSKIQLRQISSIREQSNICQGRLFIYDNRKDNTQYKTLVSELRTTFSTNSGISFIERIDEYNAYTRNNKSYDNLILLSQYSFVSLAQYFQRFKAFVVFIDEQQKLDFYSQKNVVMFTPRREKIHAFVAKFMNKQSRIEGQRTNKLAMQASGTKSEIKPVADALPLLSALNKQGNVEKPITIQSNQRRDDLSIPLNSLINASLAGSNEEKKIGIGAKICGPSQLKIESIPAPLQFSESNKPKIQLVRVSDLDKKLLKVLKEKANPVQAIQGPVEPLAAKIEPPQLQAKQRNILKPTSARNMDIMKASDKPVNTKKQSCIAPAAKGELGKSAIVPLCQVKEEELPQLSELIAQKSRDELDCSRSQLSKKSKIKRLKSTKSISKVRIEANPVDSHQALPQAYFPQDQANFANVGKKPAQSIVKSHLRMGSDNNHSRSQEKPRLMSHQRARSDEKYLNYEVPGVKICVSSPKPTNSDQSQSQCMPYNELSLKPCVEVEDGPRHVVKCNFQPQGEEMQQNLSFCSSLPKNQQNSEQKDKGSIINQLIRQQIPNRMNSPFRKSFEQNKQLPSIGKVKPINNKPAVFSNTDNEQNSKENIDDQVCVIRRPNRPKDMKNTHDRNKVKAEESYYGTSDQAISIKIVPNPTKKIMKANAISPMFQHLSAATPSLLSIIEQDPSKTEGLEIPGISNISSIPLKETQKSPEPNDRRYTFGLGDQQFKFPQFQSKPKPKASDKSIHYPQVDNDFSCTKRDSPIESQKYTKFEPRKSKSLSQVQKVFNRLKIKPAVENIDIINANDPYNIEEKGKKELFSHDNTPKNSITQRINNPRVGKIYSQLKCNATSSKFRPNRSRSNFSDTPTQKYGQYTPTDSQDRQPYLRYEVDRSQSNPNYQRFKNKGIEDLIDLSKYNKVIENGVVVYRSKYPIQTTYYTPTTFTPSTNNSNEPILLTKSELNPNFPNFLIPQSPNQKKNSVYLKENPYLLEQAIKPKASEKENLLKRSKSGVNPLPVSPNSKLNQQPKVKVSYNGDFLQQNVGVQCQADPFNSLANANSQKLMNNITKSPKISQKTNETVKNQPRRAIKSTISPIRDLLASKISDSESANPHLIMNMQSPQDLEQFNEYLSENDQNDNALTNENEDSNEKLILYLIDKAQPNRLFDDLNLIKQKQDSLISFKNEKQLAQQLPQATNIYDIVYVIPRQITKSIEKLVQNQPNCYIVQIYQGKTKIKGNRIQVPALKYLNDVSGLLLKQQSMKKKPKIKQTITKSKPAQQKRKNPDSICQLAPNCLYFPHSICYSLHHSHCHEAAAQQCQP